MKQFLFAVVSKFKSLHVIFFCLLTLLLTITTWLTWNQLDFHVRSDLLGQYRTIANTTADQSAKSAKAFVQGNDRLSLQMLAKESIKSPHLESITFYGANQEILAYSSQGTTSPLTQQITSSKEITAGDSAIGSVHVVLSTTPMETTLRETSVQILVITLAVWVLGLIALRSLFHFYELKVKRIAQYIYTNSSTFFTHKDNNTTSNTPITTQFEPSKFEFSELSPIQSAVQKLAEKQDQHSELNVSMSQLFNSGNIELHDKTTPTQNDIHNAKATVLYVKAFGLNLLKADSPDKATLILSEYIGMVQQAAKLYNGFTQVHANGIAVIFGAPQSMNEHCLHAVCAASFLCKLLNNYNKQRQAKSLPHLKFQIGIHTSDVYCFSALEHSSLSVFGDAIFEAAQLANLSSPGQISLSQSSKNEANLEDKIHCAGPYTLNLTQNKKLLIFQVTHLAEDYEKLIDRQVKHIASLRQPA